MNREKMNRESQEIRIMVGTPALQVQEKLIKRGETGSNLNLN